MLFNLDFANNTLLSYFLCFLLILNLYFSIPAVTAQFFHPTAELAVPVGIGIKEAKAGIEIVPGISEAKTRKCSI